MDDDAVRRERAELWTWQFGAALASATRIAWVIEAHFADMYDEIRFYLDDPQATDTRPCVSYNRNGRLHVLGASNPGSLMSVDVLGDDGQLLLIKDAADWVLQNAQPFVGRPDPQLGRSLRLMTKLLSRAVGTDVGGPWEWRNGYLDAASGVGRRESYFEAVPAAAKACHPQEGDLMGVPEYRYWFLVGAEELPRLAIEPATGSVFTANPNGVGFGQP